MITPETPHPAVYACLRRYGPDITLMQSRYAGSHFCYSMHSRHCMVWGRTNGHCCVMPPCSMTSDGVTGERDTISGQWRSSLPMHRCRSGTGIGRSSQMWHATTGGQNPGRNTGPLLPSTRRRRRSSDPSPPSCGLQTVLMCPPEHRLSPPVQCRE